MSDERHELGDDKFIELKDPEDLTQREHRQITAILTSDTYVGPLGSRTLGVRDYLMVNCLTAWSFGPLPRKSDVENVNVPNRYWKKICVHLDRYGRNFSLDADDVDPPEPSDS
jgi:hypothetical protein